MTPKEIDWLVQDYIGTSSDGYLLHFSYSKHEEFYYRYCDLEVDVPAYRARAGSTRKTFILILKEAAPRDQAKIIKGIFDMLPPPETPNDDVSARRKKAHELLIGVVARLEGDGEVEVPKIITGETVFQALRDAEVLLKNSGPASAVDRAHTALHAYLKKICADRGVPVPTDPSMTALFKVVREQFREFQAVAAHDQEAKRVFGSIATALDSLNMIRNRHTLAHPNELLLAGPEAMLYINLSRSVLGYLDSKLS